MDKRTYEFYTDVSKDVIFRNLDTKTGYSSEGAGLKHVLTLPRYGFIGPSWTNFLAAATGLPHLWNTDRICEEMKSMSILKHAIRFSSIFKKDSPYLELFKYA